MIRVGGEKGGSSPDIQPQSRTVQVQSPKSSLQHKPSLGALRSVHRWQSSKDAAFCKLFSIVAVTNRGGDHFETRGIHKQNRRSPKLTIFLVPSGKADSNFGPPGASIQITPPQCR